MNLVLLAGAIVITFLVFMWLLKVIRATLKTALLVAAIVFALQFFGIGPDKVVQEIVRLGEYGWQWLPGK